MLAAQLGSTTITTDNINDRDGAEVRQLRYDACGGVRHTGQNPTPTDYAYTGQYSNVADFGLTD